jgi:3-oxoadipate enol-lactonase
MRFRLKSGLTMRYLTRGVGRPVVLMHPIGLRAEFWAPVMAELEHRYRLIAIDARGHGESDFDGPFTLADLARDAVELVGAVGRGPAVFVGCSMGGMVAQGVAALAPEAASAVVIANTTFTRDDNGRAMIEQRAVQAEKGMPVILPSTLARWFDAQCQLSRPDLVLRARDWLLANDPVVHAIAWRAIRDLNFGDALRKSPLPKLCVGGSGDQSASPTAVRQMAHDLPHAHYREIEGAGHLAPLEEPAAFARHLREFIDALPAGDRS